MDLGEVATDRPWVTKYKNEEALLCGTKCHRTSLNVPYAVCKMSLEILPEGKCWGCMCSMWVERAEG